MSGLTLLQNLKRIWILIINLFYTRKIPDNGKYKVVIIGAGYSGIAAAVNFQKRKFNNFEIIEKYPQPGGTWYEANYPGAACDIAAHFYSLSFYLTHRWTRKWPIASEILDYIKEVVAHFNLNKKITYNTRVVEARWNENSKKWIIKLKSETDPNKSPWEISANFIITAPGVLNVPVTPEFKNSSKFNGVACHSYNWPRKGSENEIDLNNKRVSIIGTGASAVQILPTIADQVKSVNVYQRSAAWAPPKFDYEYSTETKNRFKTFPILMRFYRWYLYWFTEQSYFLFIIRGTKIQKKTVKVLRYLHKKMIGKEPEKKELVEKLTPSYEPGCKRITPSDTYLKAFRKPNVELITDKIEEFTENGIKTINSENDQPADVIIYATGFSMLKAMAWFELYGLDQSKNITEICGDAPQMMYGTFLPNFPNHFRILGANSGLAHNSVVFMIECQVDYIMDAIRKTIVDEKKQIDLKKGSLDKHYKYIYGNMRNKSFGGQGGCQAWYRNENNVCWTLWPNSTINFWWHTLFCDLEDYDLS